MEKFVDKDYSSVALDVLNSMRVYLKLAVISDMSKYNGIKMVSWDLQGNLNRHPN